MKTKIKIIIVIAISLIIAADCCGATKLKKKDIKAKWQRTSLELKLSAAMSQFEDGQYDAAEAGAKECVAEDANIADAHLLLGKVKIAKADYSGAKNCLETLINLKPDSDEGAFLMGIACQHLNDKASALQSYQKALELSPQNTDYIIALGKFYTSQGKFMEAEILYQQKISANPADVDLKIAAGQLYLECGQKDKAVAFYEQAQLSRPKDLELLEALGSCYVLAERWQKAHETYKQLYKLSTESEKKNVYLKVMAMAAIRSGDYISAAKYYSHLAEWDGKNAQLWILAGQAAIGANQMELASSCVKKALEISPDLPDAFLLSGSINYVDGNYSQAVDDFHKATTEPAISQFAWFMTAKSYEKMGDAYQAKAAYEKASQFPSDSVLENFLVKSDKAK